jgi:hypothetical protein
MAAKLKNKWTSITDGDGDGDQWLTVATFTFKLVEINAF